MATVNSIPNNVVKFTLADFEKVKNNGFSCPLSKETIAIIQALADQVGAPEYIKTPQFDKRVEPQQFNKKRRSGTRSYEASDEAWETVRNFKATLIVKKEGMGALIDQIRKYLNKMTASTFDTLKNNIIKDIEGITEGIITKESTLESIGEEEEDDSLKKDFVNEINKIGEAIFTIASGNTFYSSMYAKLYKELMEQFIFMKTIFETNFKKFNTLFNDFTYCDPNKDYDQFCLNNKTNEKRRALSLFYVNLMKEKLIDSSEIMLILEQLKTNMLIAVKEQDKKNIVDEMSEIVYIIITNGLDHLRDLETWDSVEEFINEIANYKPTSFPSITNKTIFKFLDILDVL